MARTYKRDGRGRFASGGGSAGGSSKGSSGRRSTPKTTSARGRALQNQRRSAALVSATRGGKGPSAKAVRSVLTAQRARAYYEATGSGKKRSAVKPATRKTAKATAAAVRARTKAGSGRGRNEGVGTRPRAGVAPQKPAAATRSRGSGKKIDVQIQRAKPGGQYGPDGHWYPGGAWMSQGKFVGGKPGAGNGASQRLAGQDGKGGSDAATRVVRNRAPAPRPIRPRGQSIPAQPKLNKTAQKLNDEFFGSSGFLSENLDKSIRSAGDRGRSPLDNTRYIAALASRFSGAQLRASTARALQKLSKEDRRSYIQDLQQARRDLPFSASAIPRVGVSQRQLLDAIRFDLVARQIAGRRQGRRKENSRSSSEEYAWVTNAMLRSPRRR